MRSEYFVRVKTLDEVDLRSYAHPVRIGDRPPDLSGDGWQCWYPIGKLPKYIWQIGIVRTETALRILQRMERHLDREEWVFALDKPIIQALALSFSSTPQQPDAHSVQAILLHPGEGLIIAAGVWHAVGVPARGEGAFYGFLLGEPVQDGGDSGWVPFANNVNVIIINER